MYFVYVKDGGWHIVKKLPKGRKVFGGPYKTQEEARKAIQRFYDRSSNPCKRKKNPIYRTVKGNTVTIDERHGVWTARFYYAGKLSGSVAGKTEKQAIKALKEIGIYLGEKTG